MITKQALKASAKARKAQRDGGSQFYRIGHEGEMAAERGVARECNPYAGTKNADAWDFGWELAQ